MKHSWIDSTLNQSKFEVLYDRDSDVLYISTKHAPASRGIQDNLGIVWRYDGDGELIGATVIGYDDYWGEKKDDLARAIAKKFDIPKKAAVAVLDHARDF